MAKHIALLNKVSYPILSYPKQAENCTSSVTRIMGRLTISGQIQNNIPIINVPIPTLWWQIPICSGPEHCGRAAQDDSR